jgi:hypothetical protein
LYNNYKYIYDNEENNENKFIDSKKFELYLNEQINSEKLNDPNYDPLTYVKDDVGVEGLDD